MGYCTEADVYRQLPPGALANPARLVSAVSTSAETFSLDAHGLADDDAVQVRADAGGALPGNISAGTTYYAIVVDDATFKLAPTAGGAAINLTGTPTNVLLIRPLPIADWITDATDEINQVLPAHVVPIDDSSIANVPRVVRVHCARRAALAGLIFTGGSTLDIERLTLASKYDMDAWAKGRPIAGAVVPERGNLAVRASTTAVDVRGWGGSDPTRLP